MALERNAVSITGKMSEGLSKFESYNSKEIYRFDRLGFTITGRLISGLSGFLIIVVMLMFTFSSAANSVMVAELGGIKSFTADVVITENSGPSFSGTLEDQGDYVDFGYIVEEADWNYISNMRISHFDVEVDWSANGGGGGGRQVTFDVSSDNNTAGESQNDGGGGGEIIIEWAINPLPETVSDTADSPEDFVSSFEKSGEWMGGTFTYTSESAFADTTPLTSESISYTITLTYYTWELENIRELSEI
ncbi:MAG: hypothetical protein MK215_01545 [Candidatus Poseidoniia archaeon]|nr:hypothetical protein [Candidatus Poseidoniia archaeon]